MALQYNLYSSIGDIAEQVSLLEASVPNSAILIEDRQVINEMEESLQHHVSFWASELKTGRRGGDEEEGLRESYETYSRLIGVIACDLANGLYEGGTDTGEIKRQVGNLVIDSHVEVGVLDYEKRLDQDIEQKKQLAARHALGRLAVAGGVSVVGSTAVLQAIQAVSPMIHISHEQQGVVQVSTAAFIVGGFAVRTLMRNGPAQIGVALRSLVNGTYREYLPPEEKCDTDDDLMEQYAERRLERPLGMMAMELMEYKVEQKEDLVPMIEAALSTLKDAFYESYDMSPKKEEGPRYRQWFEWIRRAGKEK